MFFIVEVARQSFTSFTFSYQEKAPSHPRPDSLVPVNYAFSATKLVVYRH